MTPAPEQAPPPPSSILSADGGSKNGRRKKNRGGKKGSVDPDEVMRAALRDARIAALGAAVGVRTGGRPRSSAMGGYDFRGYVNPPPASRGQLTAPLTIAPGSASANALAAAAADNDRSTALVESRSPSFDSADQAIVRGSIMASRAVGEPPRQQAENVLSDDERTAGSYDLDLTSVMDDTTIKTRSTHPGSPGRGEQRQNLSVILETSGGGGGDVLPNANAIAIANANGDARDNNVASGPQRKRRRKKKMAFPRSSILKIKIPKGGHRRGRSGDSYSSSGGSSKESSSSMWSWMSPGGTRRTKKKIKRKKKKRGLGDNDIDNDEFSLESTVLAKTRDVTEDAWMCGLCGAAFRSRALAERHEVRCVRYAFGAGDVRLGYLPTLDDLGVGKQRDGAGGAGANGGRFASDHGGSLLAGHPPSAAFGGPSRRRANSDSVFRGSAARTGSLAEGLTSAKSAAPGVTFDDGELADADTRYEIRTAVTAREHGAVHLSSSMRRCIVMTDEAVCKVALRAAGWVLTPSEDDAERELALLARDRE
eukprot:CAMPEP_0113590296 /NCGR_PEP_ID=MMETSP0015_2-20120614/36592_1 /TAXON_ID=2838 /ORGANISM="Odontella" /LENGTH=537 /DNA_ID=CAMNT_0000496465 /DNA_START=475 /DNA_END=2085 /DNA_ORIENTATION=- /assembly_acc=CAM_ASM_000160